MQVAVLKKSKTRRVTNSRPLAAVVLAAGEGKRMRSSSPKVLHEIAGESLISHVLSAVDGLKPERVIGVVGHHAEAVSAALEDRAHCVIQAEQLGTGHAVAQARKALRGFDGDVVVLCGDAPLLRSSTLRKLVQTHRRRGATATVLTMIVDEPGGYGRIIAADDGCVRIIEHADASESERAIDEVNTGTYCFDAKFLFTALTKLGRDNAQGEYYLTDIMERASQHQRAARVILDDCSEGLGVNSRAELAQAEAIMQERLIIRCMDKGATFIDPATVCLSAKTRIGKDSVIGPNVRTEGETLIGPRCRVDGTVYLKDTVIGSDVHIKWGVVASDARIDNGAQVGPYAHLRPQAVLGKNVHVGNYVEVKKSRIGRGSKANHLSYIGDAEVGANVNIGAGTITCNYDGVDKYRTVIGDRVQIGSDTQLVAPVTLGADCYVAAGSTVTCDVEAGALVFNDKRQMSRKGWVEGFRRRKRKLAVGAPKSGGRATKRKG